MMRKVMLKYQGLEAYIVFNFIKKKALKLLLYALISFFVFSAFLYLFHIHTSTKLQHQAHLKRQAKATVLVSSVDDYLEFMAQRIAALKDESRIKRLISEAYFKDLPLNHALFYLSAAIQSRITPQGPSILTKYDKELLSHGLNNASSRGVFQDSNSDIYVWAKIITQTYSSTGIIALKVSCESLQHYLNLTTQLIVLDSQNVSNRDVPFTLSLGSAYTLGYHAPLNNPFESYIGKYLPYLSVYFSICLILIFGSAALRYQGNPPQIKWV